VIEPLTAQDVADLDRIMARVLRTIDPENRFRAND